MKTTEIYYFSGTGNSLHIARELTKRLPWAELVPMAGLLGKDNIQTGAEAIGLVFPLHGMTMPIPVKMFLEKADFRSAGYVFAVVTRAGSKCLAFSGIEKTLRRQGRSLNAAFILNMPDNDPKLKHWEAPSKEKISELESEALARLDEVQRVVVGREDHREKDTGASFGLGAPLNYLLERVILAAMVYASHGGANDYFYADAKCTGCGTCARVCPSGRKVMADRRPDWRRDARCYLCYACLNFCPAASVQIKSKWWMKSYTTEKGRYSHPFATAKDIAAQKGAEDGKQGKSEGKVTVP